MIKFAVFSPENIVVEKFRKVSSKECFTLDDDIRLSDADTGVDFLDETDVEIAIVSSELDGELGNLIEKAVSDCSRVVLVGNNEEDWDGVETIAEEDVADFFGISTGSSKESKGKENIRHKKPETDKPMKKTQEKEIEEELEENKINKETDEDLWEETEECDEEKTTVKIKDDEIEFLEKDLFDTGTKVRQKPVTSKEAVEEKHGLKEKYVYDLLGMAAKARVAPTEDEVLPRIRKPVVAKKREEIEFPPKADAKKKKIKAYTLNVKLELHDPKTIAIYSPKGGTGTSTVALNLAAQFAVGSKNARPPTVVLVDFEMRYGNIGRNLVGKVEPNVMTFLDKQNPEALPDMVVFDQTTGLAVLLGPPSLEEFHSIEEEHASWVLKQAERTFEITVIDCGVDNTNIPIRVALKTADVVIFVTEMLGSSLIDVKQAAMDVWEMRKEEHGADINMCLLINKATEELGMTVNEVTSYLSKIPFVGSIPYDMKTVGLCSNAGNLLVLSGNRVMMKAFREIGDRVAKTFTEMERGYYFE
jgi:MinD-like ATPase involved in chromosome partitioning or flagellar assembly